MRYHLHLIYFLFFFAEINSSLGQTVATIKGLTTVIFNRDPGIIKLYLPDEIKPGDRISGMIKSFPAGKNTKQVEKSMASLTKYSVDFNGQQFPVSGAGSNFQCTLNPGKSSQWPLKLLSGDGSVAGQVNIQSSLRGAPPLQTPGCRMPTHALTDAPMRITGTFDGNSSNTSCSIDGKPLEILAESAGNCIIMFPANTSGTPLVHVQEAGQPECENTVNAVNMVITADKLSLLKDEKTYLHVDITGLQNLPDTAALSLENITPGVVAMQPSNHNLILLTPGNTRNGNYTNSFEIVSTRTGDFTVNVNLVLPDHLPPVYADQPKTGGDNKNDTVPCKDLEEKVIKAEEELSNLKNELDGMAGNIRNAKIGLIDCNKILSDLNDAYQAAKSAFAVEERRMGFWKTAKKEPPQNVKDAHKDAEDKMAKALAAWREQNDKCKALEKLIAELEARKAALPGLISAAEEALNKLKDELKKCETAAADEKKKKETEGGKTVAGTPPTEPEPVHPPTGAAREGTPCNPDGLKLEETVKEYGSCYVRDLELTPCNVSKLNNELLDELIKYLKKLKALAKPLDIAEKISKCTSTGKTVCVNIHVVREWKEVKYTYECVSGKWVLMNKSNVANGEDDYGEFIVKNLEFGNTCCWLFSDNGETVMETKLAEAIQAILDGCKK